MGATTATEAILAALGRARRHALSASELAAQVRGAGLDGAALDAALARLEQAGRVVVLPHVSPDVHLTGDLRTIGAVTGDGPDAVERARVAASAHWDDLLREFLRSHRCC